MADIDIDPFGEHESRPDDNTETGENIPFTFKEVNRKLHLETILQENLKELKS